MANMPPVSGRTYASPAASHQAPQGIKTRHASNIANRFITLLLIFRAQNAAGHTFQTASARFEIVVHLSCSPSSLFSVWVWCKPDHRSDYPDGHEEGCSSHNSESISRCMWSERVPLVWPDEEPAPDFGPENGKSDQSRKEGQKHSQHIK